jgi:hypothetical protein
MSSRSCHLSSSPDCPPLHTCRRCVPRDEASLPASLDHFWKALHGKAPGLYYTALQPDSRYHVPPGYDTFTEENTLRHGSIKVSAANVPTCINVVLPRPDLLCIASASHDCTRIPFDRLALLELSLSHYSQDSEERTQTHDYLTSHLTLWFSPRLRHT